MIRKIHHVGIAVKNLDEAIKTYSKLLGKAPESSGALPGGKIRLANFNVGGTALEFLEGAAGTPMADFVVNRGEGLHHIAVEVGDIVAELKKIKTAGVTGDKEPRQGPEGKIAFVGPEGASGVTIELVQLDKKK
jgi:methylmalonyl-CoA/ethylmalonyl-CoA epimerase